MSEYQYYEFQAVDRPLTPEQVSELRALSTRAGITRNRFTNTYHYGDFRGNPRKLMESYFDAHVYVSNFGSMVFMLRLPRTILPEETLRQYANNDGLEWWATDTHTILEWQLNAEPDDDWIKGENWMGQLLPLRDELVRGDYRSLYIGWLSSIMNESYEEEDSDDLEDEEAEGDEEDYEDDYEEEDEDDEEDEEDYEVSSRSHMEPPVPAGLGSLTGSQIALTEFLGVDSDLIAVAAEASLEVSTDAASDQESAQKVERWVAQLPEPEVRGLIARLIHGEGLRLETELQSRYYRSHSETIKSSRTDANRKRRTASDLLAQAAQREQGRKQQESAAKERKRHAHLAGLVPRFSELWATVNALAEEQKSSSYDKICTLLVDMHAAYVQENRRADFDAEFARFLEKYSRRTALVRRLKQIRLTS